MALTLQQRHNITNNLDVAATGATIYDKAKQALRVIAQSILDGTLLPSDAAFTNHVPQQNQMDEWALRALEGSFDAKMLPMIIDQNQISNNLPTPTDNLIIAAVKASLWPYITRIGMGNL